MKREKDLRDHSQTIGRFSPSASKRTGRPAASAHRIAGLAKAPSSKTKAHGPVPENGRVVAPSMDFEGFGSFS